MITEGQDVLFERDNDVFPELGLTVVSSHFGAASPSDNDVCWT
jgi:hypothetical protein